MKIDDVIPHITDVLVDSGMVTWNKDAVVRAIDLGINTVCGYRPDAYTTSTTLTLVSGVNQTLPAAVQRILGDGCNVIDDLDADPFVRVLPADALAQVGSWFDEPECDEVHDVYYDERHPERFQVYPPADAGIKIKLLTSAVPAATVSAASATTDFPLSDKYLPMVIDWALSRLFSADKPESPNYGRGIDHRNNFYNLMGIKIQSDRSSANQYSNKQR